MYDKHDPRLTWIYEDKTWDRRNQCYRTMSTAFARLARGSATVLRLPQDYHNPPMTGMFGQQEIPALGAYTDVVQLFKIFQDPQASNSVAPGQYLIPSSLWRTRQDVVQRNMWETERLLKTFEARDSFCWE
ncbi:hypothetical protein AC578_5778 [Pseudocercospora eumusae]|uniref:Uncharacterized protein n=1 Tax=Pseudocercospora eumusae TaxID=321146 RepID=A0A139H579_9PEZI|nr:hypothetical protein AC578_5778 [Pseudocercospora eumusae]